MTDDVIALLGIANKYKTLHYFEAAAVAKCAMEHTEQHFVELLSFPSTSTHKAHPRLLLHTVCDECRRYGVGRFAATKKRQLVKTRAADKQQFLRISDSCLVIPV